MHSNYEYDSIIKELKDIAGIEKLKNVLNEQFFGRAESVKCSSILNRVNEIIYEIKNGKLDILGKVVHQKKHTLAHIDHLGLETQHWIKSLYLGIPSEEKVENLKKDSCDILLEFENLNLFFLFEHQIITGRRSLEQNPQLFTADERQYLEKILYNNKIELGDFEFWSYWNYISQNDPEPKRCEVATAVINKLNMHYKQ